MPRKPLGQDGSIRRLKRKHGVVFRVDVYDAWGRRIRKDFPDRATAEAFLAEVRREKVLVKKLGVKPEKARKAVTLAELAERYLRWAQGALAPKTLKVFAPYLKELVARWGEVPINELPQDEVQAFLTEHRRTHAPRTTNFYVQLIRRLFNLAVEWGYIEKPPFRLKPFPEPKGRVRYLSPEEKRRLLEACEAPKLKLMVMIALWTGMRAGEIKRLRWEDIDWEAGVIRVRPGKTHEERRVPLLEPLREFLSPLRKPSGPVVGEYEYKPSFRRAVRRANIQDFHFHDLRHTFATRLVMAGVDLRTVAELLGHKTLRMVMRYAHFAPGQLERVRRVMGTFWSPKASEISEN